MDHSVSKVVLDNGVEGLLIDIPSATVMTFEFNFRAGEFLVDPQKWETPHIMEHLLLGANQLIPKAREFQAEFEKNGAYCNASTGVYDIIYEAECADLEWQRILDLMVQSITKPLFLEDEFKAEVGNVREELSARSNNHFRNLSIRMRKDFGFSSSTDKERLELLKNVELDDIKAHYKKTHTSSNMRFVIAGKIPQNRRKNIKEVLEKLSLPKGRGREVLPEEHPKKLKKPLIVRNRSVDNYYFYLDTFVGHKIPREDLIAVNLLDGILTETLYSRILGTARENGLVYSLSSGVNYEVSCTNWWFGAQVRPDNADKLFDIITYQLEDVFSGGLTHEEIDASKKRRLGTFQRDHQTVMNVARYYSMAYFFDDTYINYEDVSEKIKAVTKTQITQTAKALFSENIWGLGVLGNPEKGKVEDLTNRLSKLWNI